MIGRALLRARPLHPTTVLRFSQNGSVRLPIILAVRSYATPGRPKKVVGEPSRPVKRAVKKAASKPATGDSAAEKLVKTKKTAATKKKAKKPVKVALTPEQQAAAKEKAALKKERTKLSDAKKKLADARVEALKPPKKSRSSAYVVFFAEKMKSVSLSGKTRSEMNDTMASGAREVAAQYKALSPAELEV